MTLEYKMFEIKEVNGLFENKPYNIVYINYEKEKGIKIFKNEGNALNLLSESDFENFYKIYIFNNNFMKTIYKFGEDDYRYSEVNSEEFVENTKKFREILIELKADQDKKEYNRLKILIGENKITKKEIIQFLEFLGGEKNERESN